MPEALVQLGYMSKAVHLMSDHQLDRLLNKARIRNKKNNITGMLLYADGSFLQVIEGGERAVKDTFTLIQKDIKHKDIKILFEDTIESRHFSEWSMGFRRLSSDSDMGMIPGMNNFLEVSQPLDEYLTSQPHSSTLLKNIFMYFKRVA